jgi:hypothetical protein
LKNLTRQVKPETAKVRERCQMELEKFCQKKEQVFTVMGHTTEKGDPFSNTFDCICTVYTLLQLSSVIKQKCILKFTVLYLNTIIINIFATARKLYLDDFISFTDKFWLHNFFTISYYKIYTYRPFYAKFWEYGGHFLFYCIQKKVLWRLAEAHYDQPLFNDITYQS